MDCWIQIVQEPDGRLVRLAGRLGSAQVPDLLQACACGEGSVCVDLTDIVSADAMGIEALQRVRDKGATLIAVPEYIQLKLDSLAREAGSISPLPREPPL